MTIKRAWLIIGCAMIYGGGCGSDTSTATYHGQVRAVLERNCTSCHQEGGIAPFSLEGYANAEANSESALAEVEAGRMPPWLPTDDCRKYKGERGVSDAELSALRSWVKGGTPEGDESTYHAPDARPDARTTLGPATVELGFSDPYTPRSDRDDDYHCFILDFEQALKAIEGSGYDADKERYLRMLDIKPGNSEIVHHVIVYRVPEAQSVELQALDAQEEGPGYTCFGGAGIGSAEFLGGWAPGSFPEPWDETSAQRLPPHSVLVMQVHYHASDASEDPQTRAELWLSAARPEHIVDVEPIANLDIQIQPGDAASKQSIAFPILGWPGEIVASFPHMHLLGTEIRSSKASMGTQPEQCLVDIPKWDFHWQQQYSFLEGESVPVRIGDALRLECVYDNSEGNQPVVDGTALEPRPVRWGEGTLDEMCLNFVSIRRPYAATSTTDTVCGDYSDLYTSCRGYSSAIQCAIGAVGASADVQACAACLVPRLITCLTPECPVELLALNSCTKKYGTLNALVECTVELAKLDACASDFLDSGGCNESLKTVCGAHIEGP
ncbi:MAG: hypothetical protein H6715_04420 [Myxococcales bacterium]|nr:hypothetical protein [Myxococcales bacterium]MCB9709473.1 hypothetical protein [Myxococcales bacterium]